MNGSPRHDGPARPDDAGRPGQGTQEASAHLTGNHACQMER
jgi:hypothetical protein